MKPVLALILFVLATAPISRGNTNFCLQLPGTDSAMSTPTNSYDQRLLDFTVSARMRPAQISTGATQMIAERGLQSGSQTWTKFALGLGPTNCPFFLFDTLGHHTYKVSAPTPIGTDQWTHVAASYDHVNNMASLFVDGKIAGALFIAEESVPEFIVGRTTLGAHNPTPTASEPALEQYLLGCMDEVQVWDCAFTQTQIASNLYVKPAATESNLVAYWCFDDQTPRDATTNGMDGTLLGNAQIVPRDIACDPPLTLACEGQVALGLQTIAGATYTVECCTNLTAGKWTMVREDIAGDGGVSNIEDLGNAAALRYFRAREQ
jgi:hypothetical protein